jgi:hypothetical protein
VPEQIPLNRIDPVARTFLQLDPSVQPKPGANPEQHGSDKKPAGAHRSPVLDGFPAERQLHDERSERLSATGSGI